MKIFVFIAFIMLFFPAITFAQTLSSNGTFTTQTTILTGETALYKGNCTVTDSEASVEIRIQDNRTGTFSNSSFDTMENIYVNATNYTVGNLLGNSVTYEFLVNSTKKGFYEFKIQCESFSSTPLQSNSTSTPSILEINQAYGRIEAELLRPYPDSNANIVQNRTFTIIANATCASNNPTAICGNVNGTPRYNHTTEYPYTQINLTEGDVPFWSAEGNKTCGLLNASNVCSLNWTINATGSIGNDWKMGIIFNSEDSNVAANTTRNTTITITACAVDFTLQWENIDFGVLFPDKNENPSPGNENSTHNITVNPGSCNVDLYVRGSDLTNTTLSSYIGVGNITWSNVSNTYLNSISLTASNNVIKQNVAGGMNVTTWYWINIPPVFAGIYNGSIFITGVKSGDPI